MAIAFWLLAALAVTASVLVVGQRNPMYSVLLLILSFMALAGLYVLLGAPFVAVIQIIVYAGAIMVLFLFVVMLLNEPHEDPGRDEYTHTHGIRGAGAPEERDGEDRVPAGGGLSGVMRLGAVLAAALAVELVWALSKGRETGEFAGGATSSVKAIGQLLFTDHAFAFEVTS